MKTSLRQSRPRSRFARHAALAVALALASGSALAEKPTLESLAAKVKALEDENALLAKRLGIADPAPSPATTAKKPAASTTKTDGDSAANPPTLEKDKSVFADVPDSPSAAILGVTPHNIVHPATPADLVTSVVSGLDEHGNFQNGLAVDTAPLKFSAKARCRPISTTPVTISSRPSTCNGFWRGPNSPW